MTQVSAVVREIGLFMMVIYDTVVDAAYIYLVAEIPAGGSPERFPSIPARLAA